MTNKSSNHIQYADNSLYSSNHWIFEPCLLTDHKMIAIIYFHQSDYAIYLNPNDKRGYRSIIRLINNHQMISTLNRIYTSIERIGLSLIMSLVSESYTHIVPIVQNIIAGNNSHSFDLQTGIIQLGNDDEPCFLHGHVFGRGNPNENYIDDVKLDGPIPGEIFDLRENKIQWKSEEIKKVTERIKNEINKLENIYKSFGLTIFLENLSYDIYIIRHGETNWNIQRKLQGHTDIPLNEKGLLQAEQLQEKFQDFHFSKVVSSDLQRAYSTAQLIVKSIQIEKSSLLREKSFGQWEGHLIEELHSYLKQLYDIEHFTKEQYLSFKWEDNAESFSDVYQRFQTLIRSIFISNLKTNDPILFSTHGGVLRAILYHLDFHQGFRWQITNCAFLKLTVHVDGQIFLKESNGIKLIKADENLCSF
ncbi:hypothetical protein I4U23_000142 [Adineta vaga]|nr:hypothetical protein I4U23_000142 [Adineta vaga]